VHTQVDDFESSACMAPQVAHLETLIEFLPRACFVLNYRPVAAWLRSATSSDVLAPPRTRHGRKPVRIGSLYDVIQSQCPVWPRNATGMTEWYAGHYARARLALAASDHQCFAAVNIEDTSTGALLEQAFSNTSARCWMRSNPTSLPAG